MGPTLICDKSTLQALSGQELNMLRRYYFLNIPPVLLVEVLGDLNKRSNAAMSRDEVRQLANKLVPACSSVNANFRLLIHGELAGNHVDMAARPVLPRGQYVTSQNGKSGFIVEDAPENAALLRWQQGAFQQAETVLADVWRASTKAIDLEGMQRQLRDHYSGDLNLRTLADTAKFVDELMASAPAEHLLLWFTQDTGLNYSKVQQAIQRIHPAGQPLRTLAPYTAHCVRAALIFHFALAFGLIGTRPTTRVDLEYLYYTPFCHAFSSGDAFHSKTAHLVLYSSQTFLPRDELKTDLRSLADQWAAMDAAQKETQWDRIGPPKNEHSTTYRLWRKVMKPGYEDQKRYRTLPPETQKRLLEELKKNIKTSTPTKHPPHGSMDDCDFVVQKHSVRLNGPCICGSDKLFKDCCGRGLSPQQAANGKS